MELTIDIINGLKPTEPKIMTIKELELCFGIKKWHIYDVFKDNKESVVMLGKKRAMDSLKFWKIYFKVEV